MKKIKYLMLISSLLMLTGCVKNYNTMTIKNDKSMIYESEILISDKIKDTATENFNREEYENAGFTISEAKEDGYSGYKLTKKYDDIDKYSNATGAEVAISDILDGNFDDKILFKVQKGFLKNTYTATFKYEFDSDEYTNDNTIDIEDNNENATEDENNGTTTENPEIDNNLNYENTNTTTDNDTLIDENNTDTTTDENNEGSGSLEDLGELTSLMQEMKFTYKLVLPYKAISNNASTVSEDGKTLTWNLVSDGVSNINFSFSVYNLTNLLIIVGGAVLLIVLIVVIIIVVKNKKGSKDTLIHTDYDPNLANNTANNVSNSVNTTATSSTVETPAQTNTVVEPTNTTTSIGEEANVVNPLGEVNTPATPSEIVQEVTSTPINTVAQNNVVANEIPVAEVPTPTATNMENVATESAPTAQSVQAPEVATVSENPMPTNNSLEITLPSEETANQVEVAPKEAMFVTPNNAFEEAAPVEEPPKEVIEVPNAIELNDDKNLQV